MGPILIAICLHPHKHPDIPNLFLLFFYCMYYLLTCHMMCLLYLLSFSSC